MTAIDKNETRVFNAIVLVSALGYFVDIYDLILFSIVRIPSLVSIGVPKEALLSEGVGLINLQMIGMLIGGMLWGMLGDKKGRLSVLFGSILLYSIANIANGFVTDLVSYRALRFVAGVGLAGELGAAVTLVSEVMSKETRAFGTCLVAGVGVLGAVFGSMVGDYFSWRTAYIVGGVLGLVLLVLRFSMMESGLYQSVQKEQIKKGSLWMLFGSWNRLRRFISCVLIGVPLWFVVGILLTFSPELTRALGVRGEITASKAILWGYAGISLGDFAMGFVSHYWKSRKKVFYACVLTTLLLLIVYVFVPGLSVFQFYSLCFLLGLFCGYWALFVTVAAEHFGTNLRATVATSAPNFVRGSVVPLTIAFQYLQKNSGVVRSAWIVGLVTIILSLICMAGLEETYGKDLDFLEQ